MVGTLGKGSRLERLVNAPVHVVASTVSAALVGLGLAAAGSLLPQPASLLLAVGICLAYGAMEVGLVALPLPETGRQVPADWRYRFPTPITAVLYGALLGPGLATRIASASYGALLGVVTFAASPLLGATVLGVFGLVRAGAAAAAAQLAHRAQIKPVLSGYALRPVWRVTGAVLTSLIAGAITIQAIADAVALI